MNYHHIKMEYLKTVELCKSGHYIQAKQLLKWVVSNSKKYRSLHVDSGLSLVGVYKKLAQYKFAIDLLNYLIELNENDGTIQSILHLDLATAKHHSGDIAGADEASHKAKKYNFKSLGDKKLSYLLMLDGRYHNLCGRNQEALDCQAKAWTLFKEKQSKYGMMQVVSNIGHYLIDLGDDAQGGKFVRESLSMACHIGAQYWAARNCMTLMELAFKRGDILEAKEYGKRCFSISYSNGYRDTIEQACQSTGDYYKAIGDTEVADVFYQKAVSVGTESPSQVLEKIDRIYETSYSERRLNVKFSSSGRAWVREESTDTVPEVKKVNKVIKYRYMIGSVKSKPIDSTLVGGKEKPAQNP